MILQKNGERSPFLGANRGLKTLGDFPLNRENRFRHKIFLKNQSILVSGFPALADFSDQGLHDFIDSVKSYRKLRWLGSAALSLAYVACGRADVYGEKNIMLWDVAGAVPIVLGAGGKISLDKTDKLYCLNAFASNGMIA